MEPCCVGYVEGQPVKAHVGLDKIAGSPRDVSYDCPVRSREKVEEAGLSGIGAPRDDKVHPVLQDYSLPRLLKCFLYVLLKLPDFLQNLSFLHEVDVLVRKVERRLNVGPELREPFSEGVNYSGEGA